MNQKIYIAITSVVFLLIALLHALRLFFGWHAAIGGWTVPLWFSVLALVLAGYFAVSGFRLHNK